MITTAYFLNKQCNGWLHKICCLSRTQTSSCWVTTSDNILTRKYLIQRIRTCLNKWILMPNLTLVQCTKNKRHYPWRMEKLLQHSDCYGILQLINCKLKSTTDVQIINFTASTKRTVLATTGFTYDLLWLLSSALIPHKIFREKLWQGKI